MRLRFADPAKEELRETLRFIDSQGLGRGERFRNELRRCLSDVKVHPESWPRVFRNVRLRIMKKFGFGIYYEFDKASGVVFVGAITHLKRKKSTWQRRFKKA
jgi:plasmid stabilization system protein ParE